MHYTVNDKQKNKKICRNGCPWAQLKQKYHHHQILSLLVEHRASMKSFQALRSPAIPLTSFHDFLVSSSIVLCHVLFGLPLLLYPWGFQSNAVFSVAPASLRNVCPIQFHFLLFSSISVGFCLAILHNSSFVILSVHFIFIIRLKNLFINICNLFVIWLVVFQNDIQISGNSEDLERHIRFHNRTCDAVRTDVGHLARNTFTNLFVHNKPEYNVQLSVWVWDDSVSVVTVFNSVHARWRICIKWQSANSCCCVVTCSDTYIYKFLFSLQALLYSQDAGRCVMRGRS